MKKNILLMFISVIMISCESRTYTDISAVITNPTYEANVKPVINANCSTSGCHNQGGTFPALTNYTEVKKEAQTGSLLCKINAQCGVMPQSGKMDQGTVDMINRWAQQDYVEK
jgi:hypothetical protein